MDTPLDAEAIRHLYGQRHEIIRFQRLVGLMKYMTYKLATTPLVCIDDPVRPFFRDIWAHVQCAAFRLPGLRDIAARVVENNGLLEPPRPGGIPRQLSVWAAIIRADKH